VTREKVAIWNGSVMFEEQGRFGTIEDMKI
jgi:hypothetical protein